MVKYLSPRQLEVIDALFGNEQEVKKNEKKNEKKNKKKDKKKDGANVLREHKVSRVIFNRWLNDPLFMSEIASRIRWCHVECELILSRDKPKVAEKLVGLATSGKTETTRKACIDIINMTGVVDKSGAVGDKEKSGEELTPELAGRVLASMTRAKQGGDTE